MQDKTYCDVHAEHTSRIGRSESDIQELWKAIDRMRAFVIAGMSAVVVQVIVFVLNKI